MGRTLSGHGGLSPPDTLEPSLQPPLPVHSLESRQESPVHGAPRDGSQMFTWTLGGHTNQADPAQPPSGAWGEPWTRDSHAGPSAPTFRGQQDSAKRGSRGGPG